MDGQRRAPEPDQVPEEPVTNRDWLWGAIVVVGVTILGVASVIWVLATWCPCAAVRAPHPASSPRTRLLARDSGLRPRRAPRSPPAAR